jgi:hypothetical protein
VVDSLERTEIEFLDKKSILVLILSACIIPGFFTYLYIDIDQKFKSLSSSSGVFTVSYLSLEEIYDATIESIVLIANRKIFQTA